MKLVKYNSVATRSTSKGKEIMLQEDQKNKWQVSQEDPKKSGTFTAETSSVYDGKCGNGDEGDK